MHVCTDYTLVYTLNQRVSGGGGGGGDKVRNNVDSKGKSLLPEILRRFEPGTLLQPGQ